MLRGAAIGTERGGEHTGEAGRGIDRQVGLVDHQHRLCGGGARYRRIVIDIDGERSGGAAAVDVGDGVGEGEALVVLVAAGGMIDRRVLGDRIGPVRRVERNRQDGDAALLDQHAAGAVRDVVEPCRRPGQLEGPGQRYIAAFSAERTGQVGRIDIITRAACIAAGQHIIVELDQGIGADHRASHHR